LSDYAWENVLLIVAIESWDCASQAYACTEYDQPEQRLDETADYSGSVSQLAFDLARAQGVEASYFGHLIALLWMAAKPCSSLPESARIVLPV